MELNKNWSQKVNKLPQLKYFIYKDTINLSNNEHKNIY